MPKGYVNQRLRAAIQKLGNSGVTYENNARGVATAEGGTVESRKGVYMAYMAEGFVALQNEGVRPGSSGDD